jgi:hypothetical protein
MKPVVTIYKHNGWTLQSQDNGLFYLLQYTDSDGTAKIFIRGANADAIRDYVIKPDKLDLFFVCCEGVYAACCAAMQVAA